MNPINDILTAGVTGHQKFPANVEEQIRANLRHVIQSEGIKIGYSALALGADQIFAEQILLAGGSLVSVQPCAKYLDTFETDHEKRRYSDLRNRSMEVIELPFIEPTEEAFWSAGQRIVDECSLLVAVWDGRGSAGLGGTADVVEYARNEGRRTVIVWPQGARRL